MLGVSVDVLNIPKDYRPYIVARLVDGCLWYWGSWDCEDTAINVASEIGGQVIKSAIVKD